MSSPQRLIFLSKEDEFSKILKQRVESRLQGQSLKGNSHEWLKSSLVFGATTATYVLLLQPQSLWSAVGLCLMFSALMILMGLGVLHEAVHGNLAPTPKRNRWIAQGYDLLAGISSQQYAYTHNVLHHRYTNMNRYDVDVTQTDLLRLAPELKRMKIHRYQKFYAYSLYLFAIINWPISDIQRFFSKKISVHPMPNYSRREMAWQIGLKILHYSLALGIPTLVHGFLPTLAGYLLIQFSTGLMFSLIIQSAHVVDGSEFTTPQDQGSLMVGRSWYEHQLRTTANFCHGRISDFIFGGLNYQIEHHLFPNLSLRHFKTIKPIVQQTCAEFGVPYHYNPTFFSALRAHYRHLEKMGQPDSARNSENIQAA